MISCFKNPEWVTETAKLLETSNRPTIHMLCETLERTAGPAQSRDQAGLISGKCQEILCQEGFIRSFMRTRRDFYAGWTGYAWAGRRKIFDAIQFFDYGIIGSGDYFMAESIYEGLSLEKCWKITHTDEMRQKYLEWSEKASKINNSMFFTERRDPSPVASIERKNRDYDDRHGKIGSLRFNPDIDLKKNEDGLWELTDDEMGSGKQYTSILSTGMKKAHW